MILAVIFGLGAYTVRGLEVEEDITALMPDGGGDHSIARMAREWGLMKRVVVVIGPAAESDDRLRRASEVVAEAIGKLDDVEDVVAGADIDEAREAATLMMERSARLYRPRGQPMSGEEVSGRLAALKERLASPEALVMQEYLLADPLGMSSDALSGLEAAGTGMGATVREGRLFSVDGRHAIVFARTGFDPMDIHRSAGFVRKLDTAIARAMKDAGVDDLQTVALGGAHFAASSSSAIISDVRLAFILTAAGMVLIFLLFFRRIVLLPAAILPAAAGISVALTAMDLLGFRLHALTIGFAAAVTGISIDYAIHLLYRAAHGVPVDGPDGSRMMRMISSAREVARPVVLGCATTVIAFVLVATTGFPGIRQLAIFSAISLPVALVVTLLVLPAFHRILLGPVATDGGLGGRAALFLVTRFLRGASSRRWVVVGFVALGAAGIALASMSRLSGDPRDMGYRDPEIENREKLVSEAFPGVADQALLVATGRDLQEALEHNDALLETLLDGGISPGRILSLSPFLPARSTQQRSLEAAGEILGADAADTRRRFEEAGFKAGYFEGLSSRLEAPPIGPQDYAGTSLGGMIEEAVVEREGTWNVLTRVMASTDDEHAALADLVGKVDGCAVASQRLEARDALERMAREVAVMLGVWIVAALLLLGLVQRSALFGMRAALPALLGVVCAAAAFTLMGRPLTPVSCAGLTLVMGLGIDYGIFMQHGDIAVARRASPAVVASAFTTLAAFGVLAVARTRAMSDMGMIILVGVSVAVLTSLLLVPAITPRRGEEGP